MCIPHIHILKPAIIHTHKVILHIYQYYNDMSIALAHSLCQSFAGLLGMSILSFFHFERAVHVAALRMHTWMEWSLFNLLFKLLNFSGYTRMETIEVYFYEDLHPTLPLGKLSKRTINRMPSLRSSQHMHQWITAAASFHFTKQIQITSLDLWLTTQPSSGESPLVESQPWLLYWGVYPLFIL